MPGFRITYALFWAPREGTGEVGTSDFAPFFANHREGTCYVAILLSFGPLEKARVMHPFLILSPCLGILKNAGLRSNFTLFLAPENRVEATIAVALPFFGDPRRCRGFVSLLPSFGPPVRQRRGIHFPFCPLLWEPPSTQWLHSNSALFCPYREGRCEAPTSDFVPLFGNPEERRVT